MAGRFSPTWTRKEIALTKYEVAPIVGDGFPAPKSFTVEAADEAQLVEILNERRRPSGFTNSYPGEVAWDQTPGAVSAYYKWREV